MIGLKELFTAEGFIIGELMIQPFTLKQTEDAVNVFIDIWKPLNDTFEYVLKNSDNEICVQKILLNIQALLSIAGTIGFNSAQNCILSELCSWELPADLKDRDWDNGFNHVHICNAIYNIAQSQNRVFDKKLWICMLNCMQKINQICVAEDTKEIQFSVIEKKLLDTFDKYLNKEKPDPMLLPFPDKKPDEDIYSVFDNLDPSLNPEVKENKVNDANKGSNTKEKTYMTADANINFYKLNCMLADRVEADPDPVISKKLKKMGTFRDEFEFVKNSFESFFVFTSIFDVEFITIYRITC